MGIKEMFPDWEEIEYGNWSKHGKILEYKPGRYLEIGLYREPIDGTEYDGTYTLQIFDGDDVIFCHEVAGLI